MPQWVKDFAEPTGDELSIFQSDNGPRGPYVREAVNRIPEHSGRMIRIFEKCLDASCALNNNKKFAGNRGGL